MRDLIITQNISLDGVIDGAGGWFTAESNKPAGDADQMAANREHFEAADAFLCGRTTFEEMRGFWPHQTDDETGVSDYLNRVSKYVVSSTMADPEWENSTILAGDPVEEVSELKRAAGRDIVVTGSMTLLPTLIDAGLVDEYRLFTYPVVLGRGGRLFADRTEVGRLETAEVRPFSNGVVLTRYRTG
jgi:dihydrofolate reductase